MQKQHLVLNESDKSTLKDLLQKGKISIRTHKRVQCLKYLDSGKTYQEVGNLLETSYPTVIKWAKSYRSTGLAFLQEQPRSGRPLLFTGVERAKITALACTKAPDGYAKWSLRLLSDRLVKLEILDKISYSEVGLILKKTNFSLIENGNGVSEN
jgi:putative transposase